MRRRATKGSTVAAELRSTLKRVGRFALLASLSAGAACGTSTAGTTTRPSGSVPTSSSTTVSTAPGAVPATTARPASVPAGIPVWKELPQSPGTGLADNGSDGTMTGLIAAQSLPSWIPYPAAARTNLVIRTSSSYAAYFGAVPLMAQHAELSSIVPGPLEDVMAELTRGLPADRCGPLPLVPTKLTNADGTTVRYDYGQGPTQCVAQVTDLASLPGKVLAYVEIRTSAPTTDPGALKGLQMWRAYLPNAVPGAVLVGVGRTSNPGAVLNRVDASGEVTWLIEPSRVEAAKAALANPASWHGFQVKGPAKLSGTAWTIELTAPSGPINAVATVAPNGANYSVHVEFSGKSL